MVASEVKDLARETAEATEDISHRIDALQADAQAAVAAIERISAIITEINDTQGTIAAAVEEQTATTNEMSRNIAEAATASGEIAVNITGVASAAATTSEGVAQTLASSLTLEEKSGKLNQALAGYTYTPPESDDDADADATDQAAGSSIEAAINKALRAHWGWQKRLATAIGNGSHSEDMTVVARDDDCAFGKWLYGFHPTAADQSFYQTAKQLHAAFHQEAAHTLGLVSGGQRTDAQAAINKGGAFAEASRVLTNTMIEWKKTSGASPRGSSRAA